MPPETVGRYRIERLIAHGGMGSLYLARDPVIDRLVAIKFLKEGFDDPDACERFAREARAAGRLHHPNIVTVFDVGEHNDRPFIAMEYVPGETLAQLIGRGAIRRVWEKLEVLEDLCAGLHFAHSVAIVHRDIKPSNVMRDQSGVVKILDFGIARGAGDAVTRAGDVVGTLNYMSPEQLAGGHVDLRTDIYSVGVLAYELITGQMAFPGTIQTGVLFKILNSAPVPMQSLVPGIDPDIPAMIDRAIAREPDARYPDLESMRQDLAVVRSRLFEAAGGLDAEDALDPNAETRLVSPRLTSAMQSPSSSRRRSVLNSSALRGSVRPSGHLGRSARRRGVVLLGGVSLLALTLAATWMLDLLPLSREEPPASSAAAPASVKPNEPERAPRPATEEQVSAARATARQQMVAGQHEQALDTLIRGLALAEDDPELNRILDELAGMARRNMSQARTAAAARGATSKSSARFREGQVLEREVDRSVGADGRVPGVRAAWAAAARYHSAPEAAGQASAAAPPRAPRSPPAVEPSDRTSSAAAGRPLPTAPSTTESLNTLPGRVNAPPGVPPLPAAPKPESPPVVRDPPVDPRAVEQAAIRETLRRYTQAYESLDSAAVGRMMPSLTPQQLRDLGRDFANYRRYTVQIRDERLSVEGQTATVTCQVVRSFETKTGVEGNHTVQSVFHLRRRGSGWAIERLESR